MPSDNQCFLDEGVMSLANIYLVEGGQVTRPYDGTNFVGMQHTEGGAVGH